MTDKQDRQHTPGPWTAENFDAELEPDGGGQMWSVWKDVDGSGAEIAARICDAANARLIAAAPELLEAAKLALAEWEADQPMYDSTARALRAAIDKATGQDA